ncbi:SAM-dependent chlorinase/fluorinase [Candidatus Beckwithbacteria bacterium]|nr:SAM-dependent chlorinase/fluorinase [Candidatus Beckwithbacteria bacterium]
MATFLHLITDYGTGDPAFAEVEQRLLSLNPDFYLIKTSVPSFNTIATGFWINQFALGDHPQNMMIYSNTAPRKDDTKKRKENAGEHFIYAQLKNGMEICAVNAGYCFSFIKPHIKSLHALNVANHGSQFRSRDFYPEAVAAIAKGDTKLIGHKMDIANIPNEPKNRIAWVDGYGNIKTTIRKSQVTFKEGAKVQIIVDGVVRTALVTGGIFSVAEGELAFSQGSSGHDDPFMEIFLRGGNTYRHFNKPSVHAEIELREIQ